MNCTKRHTMHLHYTAAPAAHQVCGLCFCCYGIGKNRHILR